MQPLFQSRSRELLVTALLAALVTTACSPQQPSSAAVLSPSLPSPSTVPAMTHAAMDMGDTAQADEPSARTVTATAQVAGAFGSGMPVTVNLRLSDIASNKPMGPDAFDLAHTREVHVLAVDSSLTDYSHSHPQPMAPAGVWTYAFTPKYNRVYHVWLDVKPLGGAQQYVMLTLNEHGATAPVDLTQSLIASVGNISATLAFDAPLVAGDAAMGHLSIQRDGKPLAVLEPVMGAYGHIVGISEDWTTIAHIHPMGAEPTDANDRGGPGIDFHIEPKHAGFLKLFAQIQVDGRDVFLPFGVTVKPSANQGVAR